MKRILLYAAVLALVLAACRSSDSKNAQGKGTLDDQAQLKKKFDSINNVEILYYKDPYGDSLRYSRFFTYAATRDSFTISSLIDNLSNDAIKEPKVKPCRSEGKIFAFNRDKPVKTIYFSTRCDTCCYLYYIYNGEFMYLSLTENMRNALDENKKTSKTPQIGTVIDADQLPGE